MKNTIYVSQRSGERAELIERKTNTVVLKLESTGETKEIGSATLKRWWKPEVTETAENLDVPTEPAVSQNEPETVEADISTPESENSTGETQAAPMKLSDIVIKLESLFDILNELYFENALTRPVITVQSTPKAYGHCSTKQIWKSETEAYYEINIGAEFLNRPSENTAATMLHEMVHLHCRENDLDETCQKGRYHNKLFKQEAEARDLEIGYDRAIGYSLTTPTETFKQKLQEAGFELTIPFARHTLEKKSAASDRAKPHKYICPCCGQEVRSTADLNIVCGICDVPMGRQD